MRTRRHEPVRNAMSHRICFVTAEYSPLAKAGGLADATGALARMLDARGHDVRVFLPAYRGALQRIVRRSAVESLQRIPIALGDHHYEVSVSHAEVPDSRLHVYLVECPALYDRATLYSNAVDEHLRFLTLTRAAIEACQRMAFAPDIVHCHDWHTGLLPLYLKSIYAWDRLFSSTRTVFTIHNLGYQGHIRASHVADLGLGAAAGMLDQQDLAAGVVNVMKQAIRYADLVTTVSPSYAREIATPEHGMHLDTVIRERGPGVVGILNGIDVHEWNPETDRYLPHHYTRRKLHGKLLMKKALMQRVGLRLKRATPLLGMVSRLVVQKGIDLLIDALPPLLSSRDAGLVVLGSGDARYEEFFQQLVTRFPGRVAFEHGYSEELAHWIEAGSDMFLMPSLYEPCGLNQMYSLRYGTVPIVRRTGGLGDSVQPFEAISGSGTGIVFEHYDVNGVSWGINRALDLFTDRVAWNRLRRNGMRQDFSWENQCALYEAEYARLLA
jgi:starch synthase